jgi:hypothetical protein
LISGDGAENRDGHDHTGSDKTESASGHGLGGFCASVSVPSSSTLPKQTAVSCMTADYTLATLW